MCNYDKLRQFQEYLDELDDTSEARFWECVDEGGPPNTIDKGAVDSAGDELEIDVQDTIGVTDWTRVMDVWDAYEETEPERYKLCYEWYTRKPRTLTQEQFLARFAVEHDFPVGRTLFQKILKECEERTAHKIRDGRGRPGFPRPR